MTEEPVEWLLCLLQSANEVQSNNRFCKILLLVNVLYHLV